MRTTIGFSKGGSARWTGYGMSSMSDMIGRARHHRRPFLQTLAEFVGADSITDTGQVGATRKCYAFEAVDKTVPLLLKASCTLRGVNSIRRMGQANGSNQHRMVVCDDRRSERAEDHL